METHNEGGSEKFFKEFGKKMDAFLVDIKDVSTQIEADLKVKFEELKEAGEKLKAEIENKDRWKEVETSLKKAGEELNHAMKAAFKKTNKPT